MEKINTYEQYANALADFKGEGGRCSSNKMLTKDEITALAAAGRLYFDIAGNTFWLLEDDGYFYTGVFYVKKGSAVEINALDKDVLAELMGNETRYNQQWEDELIGAGFEKRDRYVEYSAPLAEIIDEVRKKRDQMRKYFERHGLTFRYAKKSDREELFKLWETMLGRHRYTIKPMSDAELEEMEREKYCSVICDPDGKICATSVYFVSKSAGYKYHTAAYFKGIGLGPAASYILIADMYERGCEKVVDWVRGDNTESIKMLERTDAPTGKFYVQFVMKS